MIRHLINRIIGARGHKSVDKIVGQFQSHVDSLDKAVGGIHTELNSNSSQILSLHDRNDDLLVQRDRAVRVQSKLKEIIS